MKTAIVLFCLALGFTVQAVKLSEIDGSSFGHNLMSTVYLQLKTGDSIDQVLELLQQVEDQVIQEQHDHDERHNRDQAACEADKAEYTSQIEKAQADEADLTARLDNEYLTRSRLEGEIRDHESALAETRAALAAARDLIAAQREEFRIHSEELVDALSIFNSARTALSEAFRSGSFLQTASGATFANQLKSAKLNARFAPFARILAQAASSSKLSQSAVDQILSLMDRLIANAQSTLSSERQVMQEREDAFAVYEAALEATIANHVQILGALNGQLETANANIAEWEAALEDAKWRFENFTQKLADRTAACDAENAEYAEQTQKRTGDLAIIDQVEELVSTRVNDFVDYINPARDDIDIQ